MSPLQTCLNSASRRRRSSQRAATWASTTTEYQDRFLPPQSHMTVISTTTQKNPYHPLKGTSADLATFRSYYVAHRRIKHPPKGSQPCVQRSSSTLDHTSVYKHDFRAWGANGHQLGRPSGPAVPGGCPQGHCQEDAAQVEAASKPVPQEKEKHPFESVTSYRSDYITHPLPPRTRREKPTYQTQRGPSGAAASFSPKTTGDTDQDLGDQTGDVFKRFATWSLESKVHGQDKGQGSDLNAFLSTTHADYVPHRCQRTKPILPAVHATGEGREPFQGVTTMREDYKAWDAHKEEMRCKKSPCSVSRKVKPCRLHPQPKETTVCNATNAPQCPAKVEAFCGFRCISSRGEKSNMYWSTCLDRGATCPGGGNREEPGQGHQIISCTAASRS